MPTQFYIAHQPITFTKFNEFKIPWLKLYLMTLYYRPLLVFANFIGFLLNNAFTLKLLSYSQSASSSYLSSLINFNNRTRPLHSFSLNFLHLPFSDKAIARKAFPFTATTVWNSIPQNIRLLPSIGSFKRSLKTRLFSFLASYVTAPLYTSASDSSSIEFVRSINIVIIIIITISDCCRSNKVLYIVYTMLSLLTY